MCNYIVKILKYIMQKVSPSLFYIVQFKRKIKIIFVRTVATGLTTIIKVNLAYSFQTGQSFIYHKKISLKLLGFHLGFLVWAKGMEIPERVYGYSKLVFLTM